MPLQRLCICNMHPVLIASSLWSAMRSCRTKRATGSTLLIAFSYNVKELWQCGSRFNISACVDAISMQGVIIWASNETELSLSHPQMHLKCSGV